MTNPSIDPLVGRTVAHYEILAKLGGGGMGVVYRARDTRLGRFVALKFLPQQWSHDEEAKQRFVREAQAASATEHRNICTIHDIATADDGQLFIVMAYHAGSTLKQRLEGGALPIDEALDIASQVAEGLARAHAQGVVHRDIKPGNLILAEDGVRIVDFGLATFADALQLTVAGSTLGTAPYMSPEQVRGETADARTDVWATGAILYQMLAGHVPFQGAYAEAIAYAIRHETPAPLRASRPDVPEDLEQLVFRALHKDPNVRFASGRELARALRQVRGQTMPLDLRTETVIVPELPPPGPVRRRRGRTAFVAAGLTLLAALAGAGWAMWPRERVPIVIIPVANLTGATDLDPYAMAMTQALVQDLTDSPYVRPMMWARALETLRGFARKRTVAVFSNEVVQAFRENAEGQIIVRPTLISENQQWRVQIEVIDGSTAVPRRVYSPPVAASVLRKELAYGLMAEAGAMIQQQFDRRWFGAAVEPRPPSERLRNLDAAKEFAEGLDAYEEQEYPAAYRSFQRAVDEDPRNPLAHAWAGRAAQAMRNHTGAADAADKAFALLTAQTPAVDRLLIEAIVNEVRRDFRTSLARYEELIERFPDDPRWLMERAAFGVRRAESREAWEAAVVNYDSILRRDPGLVRPHLELCHAYGQLPDRQNAAAEGRRAVEASRRSGWRGGEALSLFCLSDTLRKGDSAEQNEARALAIQALQIVQEIGFDYNLPRAFFFRGVTEFELGRSQEALDDWMQALQHIDEVGNELLRPQVLNNLAAAYESRGEMALAVDYLSRSAGVYERLGDQRGAARQQRNVASVRIRYGEQPEEGLRQALTALQAVIARGDVDSEIIVRELIGDYYRIAGRYSESSTELSMAFNLATKQNITNRMTGATVALSRLLVDRSDYEQARTKLLDVLMNQGPDAAPEAWIVLGRVQAKLGDFAASRKTLAAVVDEMKRRDNPELRPFLHLTLGELAYESDQLEEARAQFERAASFWRDTFSIESAVEARAYLGFLDGIGNQPAKGRAEVQASLDRAAGMGRVALDARCRVFLARIHMARNEAEEALRALDGVPEATVIGGGRELRLQLHYWRSQALERLGRDSAADVAKMRQLLEELQGGVPESARKAFQARPDIKVVSG